MAASPSNLETAGSVSARAAATVRSRAVTLQFVLLVEIGGFAEALIESMDIDVYEAISEEDCEAESELDSDEISADEDDYEQ